VVIFHAEFENRRAVGHAPGGAEKAFDDPAALKGEFV